MNSIQTEIMHVIGIGTSSMTHPVAAKSLNNIGIDLLSGRYIKLVKIDYDGGNDHVLDVSVGYSGIPLVTVLSHLIKMASDTVPSSIFVGLTDSNGALLESHLVIFIFYFF